MTKWIDIYENDYAEENELLNDYVERMLQHISWKSFSNQEDIVFMCNETDNGIPKMKEGAIEVLHNMVNAELGFLREYLISRILVSLLKSNIDISEEVEWWFKDDIGEEDYEEFIQEVNQYIFDDYARNLGEARTLELWEKWGKPALEKEN